MDITIEDSDTLSKICRDVDLTPKKLVEAYIASLTFLHYTYEQTRNEDTERRSFGEILTKLHQQILECIPSNLDVAPSLIESKYRIVNFPIILVSIAAILLVPYDGL